MKSPCSQLKDLRCTFLIILTIGFIFNGCNNQKIVLDNQINKLISDQLEINDRDLKKSDLLLLTELEIKDTEIQTLAGIKDCINLEKLVLQNCSLSAISELKHLTSLKYLNIALNSNINDISPIGHLFDLEVLIASGINVEDISPLENNIKLRRLYLNNTKSIKDINPLSKLTELNVLEFYDNQVSDLEPLATLQNLERLWCNENNISDISPIQGLTKLKYLIISDNSIIDLEPLSELSNLTVLDFNNNKVSNISVISDLIQRGAFSDTSYEIWWMKDINTSPFINMKSNLINLVDDKKSYEVVELIKLKRIGLIHK